MSLRGLATATGAAFATTALTLCVSAWAAESTFPENGPTTIGRLPDAAAVHRARAAAYGEQLDRIRARERRQAEARAARKAREAREAREERASRSDRSTSPSYTGDPRNIAAQMAASRYGWGSGEFSCLNALWNRESGWDVHATNSSSGAYGIPQALPGSKMAEYGSDWRDNPATQIAWGLAYIDAKYGSPCAAWDTARSQGWY
jgi:flagellar motor protein MotB